MRLMEIRAMGVHVQPLLRFEGCEARLGWSGDKELWNKYRNLSYNKLTESLDVRVLLMNCARALATMIEKEIW